MGEFCDARTTGKVPITRAICNCRCFSDWILRVDLMGKRSSDFEVATFVMFELLFFEVSIDGLDLPPGTLESQRLNSFGVPLAMPVQSLCDTLCSLW